MKEFKSKSLRNAALACAFGLVFSLGCTDGFDELNMSKTRPVYDADCDSNTEPPVVDGEHHDEEVETSMVTFTYQGVYDDYQRSTNLFHDIYGHYFSHNKGDFSGSSPNYVYNDGWMSRRWEHFYIDRTKAYKEILKNVNIAPKWYAKTKAIAQINYSFLVSLMTDTYGHLPYSSLFQSKEDLAEGEEQEFFYDSQEKIYKDLFKVLTVASDSLATVSGDRHNVGVSDDYYAGDSEKWRKFANTLRLRLALRISNIDPALAKEEGEKAIAAGVMESNGDNFATHPKVKENIFFLVSNMWLDAVMTKDLELAYKNQSGDLDPRCPVLWFKTSPIEVLRQGEELPMPPFGEYMGIPVGKTDVNHNSTDASILKVGANAVPHGWFDIHQESVWLGYSETCFMLAEAALRGWAGVSESTEGCFKNGIYASMDYFQVPNAQTETYINGLRIYEGGTNIFNSGDKELILENIIMQKWLAVFPNGAEAWAEFRRTDYPRFLNNVSNQSSSVKQGKFIKRVRFPVSEHDNNRENLPEDVYGIEDRMDIRLWWDVADTNNDSGERNVPNNFR